MALIFIENFYTSVCTIVIVYRSILALALAALFVLSSANAQAPEKMISEEPALGGFLKAMALSIPTIARKIVNYLFGLIALPLSPFYTPVLRIVEMPVHGGTFRNLFTCVPYSAIFLLAPLISLLSLCPWPGILCSIPCLAPSGTCFETINYFIPIAFPDALLSSLMQIVILVPYILFTLGVLVCPFGLVTACWTPFFLALALLALPIVLILEFLVWLLFPIFIVLAVFLRVPFVGLTLAVERFESFEKRAEAIVGDLAERLLIKLFPSLEPFY
jgi:hypothetical protein